MEGDAMKEIDCCQTAPSDARESGTAKRMITGIRAFFSDMNRRAAMRAEIMDLDRRGSLDPVLHDIGLTRPELLTMIGGYPASGRMLPAMAERVGVDLDRVGIGTRQALSRECALCHTRSACRRWLDNPQADAAGYRNFCPNAAVFDAIVARLCEAVATGQAEAQAPQR